MSGCFTWLLLLAASVRVMVSLLRWFEQTADAVDRGSWRRVALLLGFPLAVWFFPSRVAAGRPIPVPHHEPVRGFGSLPKAEIQEPQSQKLDKLREQMRRQGMLDDE